MKPMCCRFKISSLARMLAYFDIFRAMLFSALLVGLFCGMSTVYLENLEEARYSNTTTKRVDYFWIREMLVACIVIGITICGADILMALALDNILKKHLGKASLIWMNCFLFGILLRCGFYAFIWKHEHDLGLDRIDKLTESVKLVARKLFVASIAYEALKVVQLIAGVASQMEFQGKERIQKKKQVAPKRVVVGMVGGSKRRVD